MNKTTVPPTCTDAGRTTYLCPDCGYSYTENFVDPKGHKFEEKITVADCTHDGHTEYICECGFSYISDYISAPGHVYKDTVVEPNCTEPGYTKHKCKICGTSYTSAYTKPLGHTYTETVTKPSCEESGTTLYSCHCGYSYTAINSPALGHTLKETVTVPTCTKEGYTTYTCDCGYSYKSEPVPPLGHDFSKIVTMPTLLDTGYTDYTCKLCNTKQQGELRFYSDILPHAYAENSEFVAKGIDISYHNYKKDGDGNYIPIDFKKLKEDYKIDYVIIRIGYTSSADGSLKIDDTFELSYASAKAAGLDVGCYFYTLAKNKAHITEEASLLLKVLDGKQFEYPIYLDLEDPSYLDPTGTSLSGLDAAQLNEMCVAFFTTLQRAGYYTGLYVNHNWLYNLIQTDEALSRYEIWYAKYPADGSTVWDSTVSGEHLGMWQYSDKGSFSEVSELPFDLNFAYKDYPTLIKENGYNGYNHDTELRFPDTGKTFVYIKTNLMVRSSPDFESESNIIGYVYINQRLEVIERNDSYTKIYYYDKTERVYKIAYISANSQYVAFLVI